MVVRYIYLDIRTTMHNGGRNKEELKDLVMTGQSDQKFGMVKIFVEYSLKTHVYSHKCNSDFGKLCFKILIPGLSGANLSYRSQHI